MGMDDALSAFDVSTQSEAKDRIENLDSGDFELFCDSLLDNTQPGEIEFTSKRSGDGGIDAKDHSQKIAFHYTKRYDTDTKAKEDLDTKWKKNILLTNRPNRNSDKVDEVWDLSDLAEMAMRVNGVQ